MDRKDIRSLFSKLAPTNSGVSAPARLMRRVGRALGIESGGSGRSAFEALEPRSLFEGSFASAFAIAIDPNSGRGVSVAGGGANVINPSVASTDNDFFTFIAPASDFVTVLADTANENPASQLNTRVQVFNAQRQLIASGTNNGQLTSGLAADGFAGFVATAGQRYYVQVSSDGVGPGIAGTYTVRVAAKSTLFDIGGELPTEIGVGRELNSPVPDFGSFPPVPITPILGQLGGTGPVANRIRQDNIVYKFVVPQGPQWNNFATINIQSTQQQNLSRRLDTRVDIYNAQGVLVTSDSDAGRLNDAFATLRVHPGQVYYIRVRSDEIRNPNIQLATGPFFVVIDSITDQLALNPVTRVGSTAGAMVGFGDPTTAPDPAMPTPTFQTNSYEFTSQGTGLTIITLTGIGLSPVTDGALSLYDDTGSLVSFNNNFNGLNPRISATLAGGKRYFLVVDSFEINNGVQYFLSVESNHTFTSGTDDHVNTPARAAENPDFNNIRKQFELATSLKFGNRAPLIDADDNVIRDHSQNVTAVGQGRIEAPGDFDLFQFTPQVSMQQVFAGNNDDQGTSLFTGGAFDVEDPNNPWPQPSRNLGIWDAADWFAVGAQTDDGTGFIRGFTDNPATTGTNRPEIYALYDWDTNPAVEGQNGFTDHVLVVGGDFNLNYINARGQRVTARNLAFWAQDPATGRFRWTARNPAGNPAGDNTNGPVRTIQAYDPVPFDPDGDAAAPTGPDPNNSLIPELFIGGDFTTVGGGTAANHIGFFNPVTRAWAPLGAGTDGPVFAMTVWTPPDPGAARAYVAPQVGPPPVPEKRFTRDTPKRESTLIVGGSFNQAGTGNNGTNISTWNGVAWHTLGTGTVGTQPGDPGPNPQPTPRGGVDPDFNLNGPVFALTTFASADPDATPPPDGPIVAAPLTLYIGGRFDRFNGGAIAPNLVAFGDTNPQEVRQDPQGNIYEPQVFIREVGAGVVGESVLTMAVWDPADINPTGQPIDPVLIVGGDLPSLSFLGITDGIAAADPFANGTDGIVRSLTVVVDQQEPGIEDDLDGGSQVGTDQATHAGVLYAGGDFITVNVNGQFPVPASHVAQFAAQTGPQAADDSFAWTALNGGVDNIDQTADPATVFALTAFDDGNPLEWDRHDRRAQRLAITVQASDPAQPFNARVRVYDSNFNIVYGFDKRGSETISPINPDPAGMLDESLAPNQDEQLEGITVWAGETYYVEVSDVTGNSDTGFQARGAGRYVLSVTAAAAPEDRNGDGVLDDVNAQIDEEPDEGDFTGAFRSAINTQLLTGDGTNLRNSATNPGQPPLNGNSHRTQHVTPSLRDSFIEGFDLGNIQNIDDTDLYSFRAEFTGTAEIRLDTTLLAQQFGEALGGDVGGTFRGVTGTITSHLDAAMRVFRNDFVQIGYNDDNYAVGGEYRLSGGQSGQGPLEVTSGLDGTGTDLNHVFLRRDPRLVIPVVAGNFYFIQIESGQKWKNGADPDPANRVPNIPKETEERQTHGAYRLLVNQMPNQLAEIINGQRVLDDHSDNGGLATVIPMGDNPAIPSTNGRGSLTGVIRNTPNNPADLDVFEFIAPGSGNVTVTVTPTGTGNTLQPAFRLFGLVNGVPTNNGEPVATGNPTGSGAVTTTLQVTAGQAFLIAVNGGGNSQGAYRVDISGIPAVDDNADLHKFVNAREIQLFDFQGSGGVSGRLEVPGDTDIFKFRVTDFASFTVNVSRASAVADSTLTPEVTIYEVSEDPIGNPMLLRVGFAAAGAGGLATATVTFPVTPDRRIVDDQGNVVDDRDYPFYYVLVRDANPSAGFGSYNINVGFPATDDHPDGDTNGDGIFDTGEFNVASRIAIDTATGQGTDSGTIEVNSDSDLFVYTAPAGGPASIVISRPAGSIIRPRVTVLDANGTIITSNTAADDVNGTAIVNFTVVRNTNYYIVVDGFEETGTPNLNTTRTGEYTVSVITPPVDDYPNAGEFALANAASNIPLSFSTGVGRIGGTAGGDPLNARISPSGDTDLFTFTTIRAGNVSITVNPFDTSAGRIAARVQLFDAAGNLLQTVSGTRLSPVTVNIANAPTGTRYYILVSAITSVPQTTATGEYAVTVTGPANSTGGGPTPEAIDFNAPTDIALNARTGDGDASDAIDVVNDRDLFRFRTTAAGRVFVQLVSGNGSLLRASIRVLNAANEDVSSQVAFDSDGIPGAIANVSFNGAANTSYYIVVDGLGDSTGSYTVKVNTQPVVNELVYPEGFANSNIREFVSIVNPNDVAVTYTIYLRYESGDPVTQVASSTIPAHSRNGLTIIDINYITPGLRLNSPYAIVIDSDGPLGATIAHYDSSFAGGNRAGGNAIGESFTEVTSSTWNFPRVEKDPESVNDFIVFYNPNNFDVIATLTAYVNGQAFSNTLIFGALRRGGFSVNDIAEFPTGIYGATLSVTPVNAANAGAYIGVVASISHYNRTSGTAFGALGDGQGGSTAGVVTNITQGTNSSSAVDFFNPGETPATVTLTGTYVRTTALPNFTRTFQVAPKTMLRMTGADLGLSPDQPLGITYTSTASIVVGSDELQNGDADGSGAANTAGTEFFFGDGYVNTDRPGQQPEFLYLYNPGAAGITVNIKLNFLDGTFGFIAAAVNGHGFAEVRLDTQAIITSRSGPTFYAIDATSASPFVITMQHYDLDIKGGWTAIGVPFGILEDLNKIA